MIIYQPIVGPKSAVGPSNCVWVWVCAFVRLVDGAVICGGGRDEQDKALAPTGCYRLTRETWSGENRVRHQVRLGAAMARNQDKKSHRRACCRLINQSSSRSSM